MNISSTFQLNTSRVFYGAIVTLKEEDFHLNLYFAITLMVNLLNINYASYYIFRNLSIIAYIIEIQKSQFANIKFPEFDQSESGR